MATLMTDGELGRRFAAGDGDALAAAYERYAGAVRTVARARLRPLGPDGGSDLADDVVQEAFLKAWRARHRFDPDRGALAPWLYAIARRAAADAVRREQRRPPTAPLGALPPSEGPTLSDAWEAWLVRRALAELPHEERTVVHLTHFVGLSHTEVARRTGMPLGTVKTRARHAHRRLADRLARVRAGEVSASTS